MSDNRHQRPQAQTDPNGLQRLVNQSYSQMSSARFPHYDVPNDPKALENFLSNMIVGGVTIENAASANYTKDSPLCEIRCKIRATGRVFVTPYYNGTGLRQAIIKTMDDVFKYGDSRRDGVQLSPQGVSTFIQANRLPDVDLRGIPQGNGQGGLPSISRRVPALPVLIPRQTPPGPSQGPTQTGPSQRPPQRNTRNGTNGS